jgi:polyphenol oxidase
MMAQSLRLTTAAMLDAIPGLRHGFEQRLGPAGWESRDEARRRVADALAPAQLLLLQQVHGARVEVAPWQGRPEADAAVADAPGLVLGIETADCLPVLIADSRRRLVAAAHAGWRGTAAGVARAAVDALVAKGSQPEDLVAALGPAIGPCCFEVGPELRESFAAEFFHDGPRGRPHLDLRSVNARQLSEAGLRPERIQSVPDCTYCAADLYHSFRREGAGSGRMISFIGWDA